ncbi:MAG: hypothetical protein WAT92_00145 [Saprospiraceae bacterium]
MTTFKDINALVNSTAWNKARDINEADFDYDTMSNILDYVNNGLDENSDLQDQIKVILEAMDEVPNQFN